MFQSRLRAEELRRSQKGHANDNRFASTASIYRTSAHRLALEQHKLAGVKFALKRHQQEITKLEGQKRGFEIQLKDKDFALCNVDFIDQFSAEREIRCKLQKVCLRLERLKAQNPEQLWRNRVQHLKAGLPGSNVILNYASGNANEIYVIDGDRCDCGRVFEFKSITYTNVCKGCKLLANVLVVAEDAQIDILQAKLKPQSAQTSSSLYTTNSSSSSSYSSSSSSSSTHVELRQETPPELLAAFESTSKTQPLSAPPRATKRKALSQSASLSPISKKREIECDMPLSIATSIANTGTSRPGGGGNRGGNVKAYNTYLLQFAPDACQIPKEVFKLLSMCFASIHVLSSLRCRPVPVQKILKENNRQDLIPHAVRISKLFNAEPIPILPHALIARLVHRWHEIRDAANEIPAIKSLPAGFEMLTHVFLLAENRPDLANAFATHKTHNISATQTQRLCQLIEKCARTSRLSWAIDAWDLPASSLSY